MEEEKVVEEPVPGEKEATPFREYTVKKGVEPGGEGEPPPTEPLPEPPSKEGEKE